MLVVYLLNMNFSSYLVLLNSLLTKLWDIVEIGELAPPTMILLSHMWLLDWQLLLM